MTMTRRDRRSRTAKVAVPDEVELAWPFLYFECGMCGRLVLGEVCPTCGWEDGRGREERELEGGQ